MTDSEQKLEYLAQVRSLLQGRVELNRFERFWNAGDFRKAYVIVEEAIKTLKLAPDEKYRKADKDFYWLYIA